MSTIPNAAGSGPVLGVQFFFQSAGTTNVATLTVPAGADVQVELWGGGGGGAGSNSEGSGSAGGGGGAYVCCRIPADVWALGGNIVIGAGGAGGAVDANGLIGVQTTLTLNSIVRATAGPGNPGLIATVPGGNGGVASVGTDAIPIALRNGYKGGSVIALQAGAGGASGLSAAGAGGAGGPFEGGAGTAGQAGAARITY